MISMPASRRLRAMIFAPRSWPSRPGLAITMRMGRSMVARVSHVHGELAGARVSCPGRNESLEDAMRSTVRKSADVASAKGDLLVVAVATGATVPQGPALEADGPLGGAIAAAIRAEEIDG